MRQLTQALRPAPRREGVTAPPTRRPAPSPRPTGPVPTRPAPTLAGSGRPLDAPVRSEMESAFGTSLAEVRVHDGPAADRAAEQLRARAFSFGPSVAFAQGQFRPSTPEGRGLLAHEIAQVLQDGAP